MNRYKFLIFIFTLEYFKKLLSPEPLHAELNSYPPACSVHGLYVLKPQSFLAKPYSITAGETSICLWITARE
jgi:hypothetical protein